MSDAGDTENQGDEGEAEGVTAGELRRRPMSTVTV